MAEFCLSCFNKLHIGEDNLTEDDVVMQWDLCEGCGRNAPCVMQVKTKEQITYEREKKLDE